MSKPTRFEFSEHSKRRALERGITEALFIEVVTSPDRKKQEYRGTHGGFVYLFTKSIDGKELNIVAEIRKEECYFATGYWT